MDIPPSSPTSPRTPTSPTHNRRNSLLTNPAIGLVRRASSRLNPASPISPDGKLLRRRSTRSDGSSLITQNTSNINTAELEGISSSPYCSNVMLRLINKDTSETLFIPPYEPYKKFSLGDHKDYLEFHGKTVSYIPSDKFERKIKIFTANNERLILLGDNAFFIPREFGYRLHDANIVSPDEKIECQKKVGFFTGFHPIKDDKPSSHLEIDDLQDEITRLASQSKLPTEFNILFRQYMRRITENKEKPLDLVVRFLKKLLEMKPDTDFLVASLKTIEEIKEQAPEHTLLGFSCIDTISDGGERFPVAEQKGYIRKALEGLIVAMSDTSKSLEGQMDKLSATLAKGIKNKITQLEGRKDSNPRAMIAHLEDIYQQEQAVSPESHLTKFLSKIMGELKKLDLITENALLTTQFEQLKT